MRNAAAIFLIVIYFVCWPYGLDARERKGNQIDIYFNNGKIMMCELIGVKSDHLMVLEFYTSDAARVDIDEVQSINISKQSRTVVGLLFGGLVGLGTGLVAASVVDSSRESASFEDFLKEFSTGVLAFSLSVVAGVTIGGLIGSAAGEDERIYIEGQSEAEIQKALNRLRRYARIPDYR